MPGQRTQTRAPAAEIATSPAVATAPGVAAAETTARTGSAAVSATTEARRVAAETPQRMVSVGMVPAGPPDTSGAMTASVPAVVREVAPQEAAATAVQTSPTADLLSAQEDRDVRRVRASGAVMAEVRTAGAKVRAATGTVGTLETGATGPFAEAMVTGTEPVVPGKRSVPPRVPMNRRFPRTSRPQTSTWRSVVICGAWTSPTRRSWRST